MCYFHLLQTFKEGSVGEAYGSLALFCPPPYMELKASYDSLQEPLCAASWPRG